MTTESIEKATNTAAQLVWDLRAALHGAPAVEAILVLQLIDDAARLRTAIGILHDAKQADAKPPKELTA